MTQKRAISNKGKRQVSRQGCLIIIGGREDKEGDRLILSELAKRNAGGKLVVITAASEYPEELWQDYQVLFKGLGIKKIHHLQVTQPEDARDTRCLEMLQGAKTIFFTGGDQLKLSSKIGGTVIEDQILEIYRQGGIIAGTSAGASVMGQTMLVGGEATETHKIGNWMMAPGFGLAKGMMIDQHFAQRGRIGRLLGAVALNPGILGIGIDEDTAVIVDKTHFEVMGSNAVYVIDGHSVSYTNISEDSAEKTMSMHDVKLHILAHGESYDFRSRKAISPATFVPQGT